MFELPLAWTGKTAARLLVLPARGETLSSAWTLWWERARNSFSAVRESGLFGRRGGLNAGLSATGLFCLEGGLDVTFSSPDDDLEDMPFDEGVGARRFLIFLGDEILFEWDAPKWALAVGLKVQPRMLHLEVSLADVAKITHPVLLRALRPLGPANLTANGDGVAPTYSTGQDVVLDWDLTSEGRDEAQPEVDLESRSDQAILELWAGAVLKETLYVNRAGPHTLTNAALFAALGAETDFTVRAYLALGGHRSLDCDSVTVSKT
ncbi:MAG: hypothetical protein M5U12_37875 [Verrucomicrobia bacterium]|nr:hypothetical protein [Verrucomicrobiota bacterium]